METLETEMALAATYSEQGRLKDAIPLFEHVCKEFGKTLGAEHVNSLSAMGGLAAALLNSERFADAEMILRDLLRIRLTNNPNDWTTFNAKTMLGAALLGQQKYSEAEPLMIEGFRGLMERRKQIPEHGRAQRFDKALDRLIRLYDVWGKSDEAARWKAERVKLTEILKAD